MNTDHRYDNNNNKDKSKNSKSQTLQNRRWSSHKTIFPLRTHTFKFSVEQTIVLIQRIRFIWFNKYNKSFNYVHYNIYNFKHNKNRQHFLCDICFLD